MIKRIFSVILIITLSLTSFIPISAKTSISSENEFKEIVEKSKYYKDYADEVIQYDVLQCIKYTCKSWSYDVSYQSSPGCTAIVGKPCEIFSLMKKKIVAAICKSGVWAACHFSVDKVCTGYYETFDVCDL